MKLLILFSLIFTTGLFSYGQHFDQTNPTHDISPLFKGEKDLKITLNYSKKDILSQSNDSTYLQSSLSYIASDNSVKKFNVGLRSRGNYRRLNCYYLPLWLKFDTNESKGSIFEEDKKLKVVLPCLKSSKANDHVVKEFLAYKIYEIMSPYHFDTKLVYISLIEDRDGKQKDHDLLAILIQDTKKLAASYDGKRIKRHMDPNGQDPASAVRNALFQYMIGNTDYSIVYRHNEKLFYIDDKIVPIPYDFDMSGLVNASYAVVSAIKNKTLPISDVTTRLYRGFDRDEAIVQEIREEYIAKENEVYSMVDYYQPYFKDPKEFKELRNYLDGFYKTIKDDKKFENSILKKTRSKLD